VDGGSASSAMKITGALLRLLFLTCRIDSLALRAGEIDDQLEIVRHRTMMDHDSAFRQPAKQSVPRFRPPLVVKASQTHCRLNQPSGISAPQPRLRKQEAPALRELGPFSFQRPVAGQRRQPGTEIRAEMRAPGGNPRVVAHWFGSALSRALRLR
jgi:hypothetical protein